MGFLALQREYKIEHIVAVCNEKKYGGKVICIGSPYIHDIIVIGMDGAIIKRDDGRVNENLKRYMQEFDADPEKLKRIVTKDDDFSEFTIPVYIYDFGRIRKEFCKEIGWPNVTTKGELMYENTSFGTFKAAFKYAVSSVKLDKWSRKFYREDLLDDIKQVLKRIKFRWELRFNWLYVNTILRVKSFFLNN
jgi:hypothetical protein